MYGWVFGGEWRCEEVGMSKERMAFSIYRITDSAFIYGIIINGTSIDMKFFISRLLPKRIGLK